MINNKLTVYIYNAVEDELANNLSPKDIQVINRTSDCFFWAAAALNDQFIYLSPRPISPNLKNYVHSLIHYHQGKVLTPRPLTQQICLDTIADKNCWQKLINYLKKATTTEIIAYANTPQFYRLIQKLRQKNLNFSTPQAPLKENAHITGYLGSKAGFRRLLSSLPLSQNWLPQGKICTNRTVAIKWAKQFYRQYNGVVVKTNHGSGGSGVFIFNPKNLPTNNLDVFQIIEKKLSKLSVSRKSPLIIEEYLSASGPLAYPNIEMKIAPNGKAKALFYGAMQVSPQGEYEGMDVAANIFSSTITKKILTIGYYLARYYATAGYRGHFDVDMILTTSGRLYTCESNVRHTGWTDIYLTAAKLLGPKFFRQDYYVLSRENQPLPCSYRRSFTQLLNHLSPLLYSAQKKQGIIINSPNPLTRGYVYYTLIARNKIAAEKLKQQLKQSLKNLTNS